MREIKFRARDKNGEWAYGFYASGEYDCGGAVHYIVNDLTHIMSSCWGVDAIEVDHGTLGQSTGLIDRNGVEVYEGDIVQLVDLDFGDLGRYEVEFNDESAGFVMYFNQEIRHFIDHYSEDEIEVIGNIYENAELLEE